MQNRDWSQLLSVLELARALSRCSLKPVDGTGSASNRRDKVPATNGFAERFNRTVLDELFRKIFWQELYESVGWPATSTRSPTLCRREAEIARRDHEKLGAVLDAIRVLLRYGRGCPGEWTEHLLSSIQGYTGSGPDDECRDAGPPTPSLNGATGENG